MKTISRKITHLRSEKYLADTTAVGGGGSPFCKSQVFRVTSKFDTENDRESPEYPTHSEASAGTSRQKGRDPKTDRSPKAHLAIQIPFLTKHGKVALSARGICGAAKKAVRMITRTKHQVEPDERDDHRDDDRNKQGDGQYRRC